MPKIAVVGATGLVGKEILSILQERKFPVDDIVLFASAKSEGIEVKFNTKTYKVRPTESFKDEKFDFAFFSAGGSVSKEWVPKFAKAGAVVIDNTNAFRMDPDVPLVVPEVNPKAALEYKKKNIISNPNCSTIQMVAALKPLDDEAKIKRVVVSTYQATSGAGKEAMEELSTQVRYLLNGKESAPEIFPHQIAFNCIPHIDVFEDNAYTREEMKMIKETSKIMGRDIPLTATCVRVPVFASHSESINIEFEEYITPDRVRSILSQAPGIKVMDDPGNNLYPLNVFAGTKDETFVGRIRKDESVDSGINMWVVSDNLRKGAALNAVQIAELLLKS